MSSLRTQAAFLAFAGAQSAVKIAVRDCAVYQTASPNAKTSCIPQAKAACEGAVTCELPIGLTLTDGKDLAPDAWKHVVVRYACGKTERSVGPYEQDDHATVTLTCFSSRDLPDPH